MQKSASKRWIFVTLSLPAYFLSSDYLLTIKRLKKTTLFFKKRPCLWYGILFWTYNYTYIRPHKSIRMYNYMGIYVYKHVFWCGKNILWHSLYFCKQSYFGFCLFHFVSFLVVTLFFGGANKNKIKKAIFPDSQSFVNLKSNTMKNTVQIYEFLRWVQILRKKKSLL